ncbi:MAG TPA: hypothetical protein VHP58_02100 [Alphaproteobacteria bacterium]|nr:hypothetical protein [Alphaproteobacteria bacterium]
MATRKRAYQQGSLDGLCGLYAITNAFRRTADLPQTEAKKLFHYMVKAHKDEIPAYMRHGTTSGELMPFLKSARDWVKRNHNVKIKWKYRGREEVKSVTGLQKIVARHLRSKSRGTVIAGSSFHWTVVHQRQDNLWFVDDSDGYEFWYTTSKKWAHKPPLLIDRPTLMGFFLEKED